MQEEGSASCSFQKNDAQQGLGCMCLLWNQFCQIGMELLHIMEVRRT